VRTTSRRGGPSGSQGPRSSSHRRSRAPVGARQAWAQLDEEPGKRSMPTPVVAERRARGTRPRATPLTRCPRARRARWARPRGSGPLGRRRRRRCPRPAARARVLRVEQVLRDGPRRRDAGGRVEVVEGAVSSKRSITPRKSASGRSATRLGRRRTEGGADLLEHAVEVGALAVELVDHDDAWQAELFGRPPGVEVWAAPRRCAHDNHGQLDGRQRERHLVAKSA